MNTLLLFVCQYGKSNPPLHLPLHLSVYSLQCPSLYPTSLLTLTIATHCFSTCVSLPVGISASYHPLHLLSLHPRLWVMALLMAWVICWVMCWWPKLHQLFLCSIIVEPSSGNVPSRIVSGSCLASPMTPILYVLHAMVSVLMLQGMRSVQAGKL